MLIGIKILFSLSIAGMIGVTFLSFKMHKYIGSMKPYTFVFILISDAFLLSKSIDFSIILESAPMFFMFLTIARIIYSSAFISNHLSSKSKIGKLINSRFSGAKSIFWHDIITKEHCAISDLGVLKSKKKYQSDDKCVFETKMTTGNKTDLYYSDFYKEIQIITGEINIIFTTGEIENIVPKKKVAVRPYEVHYIECVSECKLIVTCIKYD